MTESAGQAGRLESWKEIAAYLERNVITVQRWEKQEGLPVHRHSHQKRSSVYAYVTEIDRWRESRKTAPPRTDNPRDGVSHRYLAPSFALTLALCLIMAGNGVRPQAVEAEQRGERRTLICAGGDCGQGKLTPDVEALLIKDGPNNSVERRLSAALPSKDAQSAVRWVLSPDGSKIAYTPLVDKGSFKSISPSGEVIVVKADGSAARTVYKGGIPQAWSPDGSRILVASGEAMSKVVWVDAASGRTENLPDQWNLLTPVVSPDGRFIAFSAGKDGNAIENVFVMGSDGSGKAVVSASPGVQVPVGWMPDGKTLVYLQYGEPESLWAAEVVNGRVQGPPVNIPGALEKDAHVLGISRGGALYYSVGSGAYNIYTASMDPASGKVTSAPAPVPLLRTGSNILPRWAPDSRRLLFLTGGTQRQDPEAHVFSFDSAKFDSGKDERIAVETKGPELYCWSRDGRALFGSGPDDPRKLSRFDLESGKTTVLFTDSTVVQLSSCAGDWAVVRVKTKLELRNLVNGSKKEIFDAGPDAMAMDGVISHDGRSVAFTKAPLGGLAGGPKAIRVVSSNGGTPRDVVTVAAPAELKYGGVAWSADDRFLYFTRRADARSAFELYRVAAAGGQPESMGLKQDGLGQINISPDGSRIAFSSGSSGEDVWAMEGFLPGKR